MFCGTGRSLNNRRGHGGGPAERQENARGANRFSSSEQCAEVVRVTFERQIRDQLGRMLSDGGFDPARDIEAITVNRWPHGYIFYQDPATGEVDDLSFLVATVDASTIALRHGLGSEAQPVVNTAILGAFVRATGIVTLEDILEEVVGEITDESDEAEQLYRRNDGPGVPGRSG